MILTIDANIAFVFDRDHRFWNHCGPSGSYIKSRLRTDSPCKVPSTGVELLPYVGCVFSLEVICYSSSSFFQLYYLTGSLWNSRRVFADRPAYKLLCKALHPWQHAAVCVQYQI